MKRLTGETRRKHKKEYSKVVQEHHITRNPDWTVKVFKGEHWILTQMSRFTKKDVSMGFLTALNKFLQDNRERALYL